VIPYGKWVHIVVRLVTNCYTPVYVTLRKRHSDYWRRSVDDGAVVSRESLTEDGRSLPTLHALSHPSPLSPHPADIHQQDIMTKLIKVILYLYTVEWWGADVVICPEWGADCLHMIQLMPLHPKTPSPLDSLKSRLVLPFWYRHTQAVLEKRPLNRCSSVIVVVVWPFSGHYTEQPVMGCTPSKKLKDLVAAQFYCLHANTDGNQCRSLTRNRLYCVTGMRSSRTALGLESTSRTKVSGPGFDGVVHKYIPAVKWQTQECEQLGQSHDSAATRCGQVCNPSVCMSNIQPVMTQHFILLP